MKRFDQLSNERGATGLLIAITLATLMGTAAFAVDIGHALATRQELRNIADSAVLAGTRVLGQFYEGKTLAEQTSFVLTDAQKSQILTAMSYVAGQNKAANIAVSLNSSDVQIGQWDGSTLTATTAQPKAIAVTLRFDSSANGPMSTIFAKVFGVSSLNLYANATAALLPVAFVPPGGVDIPVGISKEWFETQSCGDSIKFHPTGTLDGCAGWHTFDSHSSNASTLKTILTGLENGTYQSPPIYADQTQFNFIGGDAASAFDYIESLYDAKKDASGNWETYVVVYDQADCNNPSGLITILGFAKVTIFSVQSSPSKQIIAQVDCDAIIKGRPGQNAGSGGAGYGVSGSIPALVA